MTNAPPTSSEENQSPLAEATPESLDELFSRDPLELSDDDVVKVVHELRARRNLWNIEEQKARADERRPNSRRVPKNSVTVAEAKAMKAEDLLGEIQLDL